MATNYTNKKTKKNKLSITAAQKQELWNLFKIEKQQEQQQEQEIFTSLLSEENEKKINKIDEISGREELECIYSCDKKQQKKTEVMINPNMTLTNALDFCRLCNYELIIMEEGFPACKNPQCGVIYKDILDQGAEWRFVGPEDSGHNDPNRCGMPLNPLFDEYNMGCKVLFSNKMTYQLKKIRRYVEWHAIPYKEKVQYDNFQHIINMAHISKIPKIIVDDALFYNKKISEYNLSFRGNNRDGIIAASIYISCRVNNYPRTAKEIANIFQLNVHSAIKGCKMALSIINILEKDMDVCDKTFYCMTTPFSFIERYCSRVEMNTEFTRLCIFICLRIQRYHCLTENTPHAVAAGIVFFVSNTFKLGILKKRVHEISEISDVTINKCFKKIEAMKKNFIPSVLLEKYSIVL